jgi:hypothetical protein
MWLLQEQKFRSNATTPSSGCKNRHKVFLRRVRLLVTDDVVPSSPILATLMMGALLSFETSVLTRATPRNIPEDRIFFT